MIGRGIRRFGAERWWRLGRAGRLRGDRRGAIGVQMALLMIILMGFLGLGLEVTSVLMKQKKMQNAADAAVVAGSTVGLSSTDAVAEARAVAAVNGYANGSNGVSVAFNSPPLSGSYASNANAQEVVITASYTPHLISLIRPGAITVQARSVAYTSGKLPGCLLALATSGTSITLGAGASVVNSTCQVMANSTSATSLTMASGTSIAGAVYLVGGASTNGATISGGLLTYQQSTGDPYSSVTLPTAGTCLTGIPSSYSGTVTINPGHYCSGITISNNAHITFSPGVYFVDTLFKAGNNAVLTATGGVTVILNAFSSALSSSNFAIGNNVQWSITAPTSGTTAGIAFTAQPTLTGSFQFNNGALVTVIGAIYMPKVNVTFQGNAKTTATSCSQLIANTITISSTVNFQGVCANTAIKRIGVATVHLAE